MKMNCKLFLGLLFSTCLLTSCSVDSAIDSLLVKDADGNIYNTVKIGTQEWTVENLKTTHYRNGDPIVNITDEISWSNTTTAAYCVYKNSVANDNAFGKLYNWYAVTDSRNIAPAGWHVATKADWTKLSEYLGVDVSGEKLKQIGSVWYTPSSYSTDLTGFKAIPGGRCCADGSFTGDKIAAYFWTSTGATSTATRCGILHDHANPFISDGFSKNEGYSVRLVRD